MSGHIIRQLEERHVASKVDVMVWSVKMDLLALSNSKGEVSLHRLTWQRVWTLPPPSPQYVVRHIAWRPDGRVIAIAYVPKVMVVGEEIKGEVMLVDVENKEILHVTNVTDDVSCLVWLQEKQYPDCQVPPSHSQDGTSDFLPKLPSLSRTFGSLPDNIEENLEDSKKIKDQTHLNFLLIGTRDGNLYLSVFGLFSCGVMNINKYMTPEEEGKHTSVLSAEMSPDMKSLYLLIAVDNEKFYTEAMNEENVGAKNETVDKVEETKTQKQQGCNNLESNTNSTNNTSVSESDKTNENVSTSPDTETRKRGLKMLILDTRVLSSRSRELHALSLKHGHVISLLDYLAQTMSSIIEAWENIYLLEIESKLSKHAASQPEGSLSADFLELLLFGVPSEALENFLMRDLNDKSIKKLGHSIEQSHSNIQKLILKHLLSVGQSLAYHLAEMKGMAKLTDRFKVLGLEEQTVSDAFSATGSFLIKATEVQLVIDESMKKYKAFFRWLYAIILRITDDRIPDLTMTDLNQQDLEFIADYLSKIGATVEHNGVKTRACHLDRLGQYLVNQDLTDPPKELCLNRWQELLEENKCLLDFPSIIDKNNIKSLVQQHKHLKEAIGNVFKTPEYAIGNMFQQKKILSICQVAYKRLSMCLTNDQTVLLALIENDSPYSFKLIQIPGDGISSNVLYKSLSFKSQGNVLMKCLDIQFYLPEILSVLFEEQDGNRTPVIMQVMMKPICEHSLGVVDGNTLSECIISRQIPDLVASNFAVSGTRKVAIVLSESRRKVRLFEMEAEDEEEEEEIILLEQAGSFVEPQKYYKSRNGDEDNSLVLDSTKLSLEEVYTYSDVPDKSAEVIIPADSMEDSDMGDIGLDTS